MGGGWGKPSRCLTFLSGSVKLFQHHSAPAEALGCLNLSIWMCCRCSVNITHHFMCKRGHRHACLLSCSVQVHPELVQRRESELFLGLDMELEFR